MTYILVCAAVVGIWLIGLGICASAGRADRAIEAHAQEREARDALRTQHSVVAFPTGARLSSSGVNGNPPGRSSDGRSGGEPAA